MNELSTQAPVTMRAPEGVFYCANHEAIIADQELWIVGAMVAAQLYLTKNQPTRQRLGFVYTHCDVERCIAYRAAARA
jgi:hypothetical protein